MNDNQVTILRPDTDVTRVEKLAEAIQASARAAEAASQATIALTNLLAQFAQPTSLQSEPLELFNEVDETGATVLDARAEPDSIAEFFEKLTFLRKKLRDLGIYRPLPEPDLRQFAQVLLQQAFLSVGSETDDKETVLGNQISLEHASQPILIPSGANFPDGSFSDPYRTLGEFLGFIVKRTLNERIARQFSAAGSVKDGSLLSLALSAIIDLNLEELYATDPSVKADLVSRLNQFPSEFGVTPQRLNLFLSSPYTTVREVIYALNN